MFDRIHAIIVARMLKIKIDILVINRSCLSVMRRDDNGLATFSAQIAAGASIAELVVLIMADNSDPKKSI